MITIVTDTLSCIPVPEARQLGIPYIPQIIIIGEDSYRDDTEIDSKTFLSKLKSSPVLPKTAAPPPEMYRPIFEEYATSGNTVIVLCPSSLVSGTFRGASVAAQDFPEADIRVVDTLIIATGLGSVARKAVQWVAEGMDSDLVVNKVQEMARRWRVYFLVDTLEYLHKGGRIGAAQALLGGILQVKPILTLIDGHIDSIEKQRTKRKALERLHELIYRDCPKGPESFLTILQLDAEIEARTLASDFARFFDLPDVPVVEMPPAIAVHAGPGVLGVGYFKSSE
jgi:DegV family protein with EDD domain